MFKKYFSASAITVISSVVTKLTAFIMIAVLTHLISEEQYGEYSVFSSWEAIVSLIIGGSFASSFGIAKKDFSDHYSEYLNSIIGLSYVLFLISFLFFAVFRFNQTWVFLILVIVHSFNMNMLTNYDIRQTFDFKFGRGAIVSIFTTIFCSICVICSVWFIDNENKGMIAIVAWTISHAIISMVCQASFFKGLRFLYNKVYWSYALKNSYMMVAHNLSLVILNQMDRIMIAELISKSYVAIYSVIYSLSIVISILWIAIKKVWVTWLYDRLEANDKLVVSKMNHWLVAGIGLLIINYCYITPDIIKLLFKPSYWDGIDMMAPILFGYFYSFLFSIYVNIEYYYKKSNKIAIGTVIAALINIFTNYLFIQLYGYKASAYTTLLSYFVLYLYHYFINRKNNYINTYLVIIVSLLLIVFMVLFQFVIDVFIVRMTVLLLVDGIALCILKKYLYSKGLDIHKIKSIIFK